MNSSQLSDSRHTSTLKAVPNVVSAIAILVGCLVLVGWMFDIPFLKSVNPAWVTMKPNTALGFLLSGVSLGLLHQKRATRRQYRIGQVCAFTVILLGLLTLSQYLFNYNLGIDELLFREPLGAVGTSHLGRMAPNTSLNFSLLGLALLLLGRTSRRWRWLVQFLTLTVALVALQPLIGYAYGFTSLYGIASYTQMAVHTVVMFIVLCFGILLARPHRGLVRIVTSNGAGGFIARRLLLAAIAIPFVIGYLIVKGYHTHLFDTEFGLALLVMVNIVIFTIWIWQSAATLDEIDTRRQRTEAALHESEARFKAAAQGSFDAIYILQSVRDDVGNIVDFKFIDLNARGAELISLSREAVLNQKLCELIPINRTGGFFEKYKQVVETGVALEEEFAIAAPQLRAAWLHHQVVPLGDGIAITSRDITERKQTEAALKESEERFRKFFEQAPIGISVVDTEGRLHRVNQTYCQLLGYTEPELNQLTFAAITHPEDVKADLSYTQQLFNGEIPNYQLEKRYIKKNGEVVWVNLTATLISEQGGNVRYGLGMVEDITERKRAEAALRDTNQTLQALIQASPLAIMTLDVNTNLKLWSPAAERIFGWAEQEVIGRPIPFLPEDEHNEFHQLHQLKLHGEPLTGIEVRRQKKDGSPIDIAIWGAPLHDTDGNICSTMAVIADITARKQAEAERAQLLAREQAARAESEATRELISKILESITDGFIAFNRDWCCTYVNREGGRTLGRLPSELIGKNLWEEFPELRDTSFGQLYRQAVAERVPLELEDYYSPSDEWFAVRAYPSAAGLSLYILNVTERKRAEETLRQSEERLRLALDAGNAGVWDWNLLNNHVTWSERMYEFYGITPGTFSGKVEDFAKLIHPDDQEQVTAAIRNAIAQKASYQFECRIVQPSGATRWLSTSGRVFEDVTGKPVRMLGATIDTTQRKATEVEREQLLAREQAARSTAEAANRTKDEFLATLSHELRTPLNAMQGWIQLLRTRKFDQATVARALETIDRNTKSLAALIEDVLDVSRIIRGKLHLNMRPVELSGVIEAAIDTVRPAATLKEIQIESRLDRSVGTILGDANRLQQVVWNLLSNAVKFTPKGERVEVQLERVTDVGDSPYIQIQVRDTGKGIAADFLPYVFERFRQENSSTTRAFGGLGLGLAIVRHLVELHGGTVSVDSPGEGQGATFTVQLPLVSAPIPPSNQLSTLLKVQEELPLNGPLTLDGLQVLVVDDEADARELLTTILGQYGAQVTAVASVGEALATLQQLQFDVLVSDIGMPGEDGYSLMRQVRALGAEQGRQIPAVALTAYARAEDRLSALAAGFQLHIAKPVNPEELAAVVANLAGRTTNE